MSTFDLFCRKIISWTLHAKTGFALITLSRRVSEKRNKNNNYNDNHDTCTATMISWCCMLHVENRDYYESGGCRFPNTTIKTGFAQNSHRTKMICIQLRSRAWSLARQIFVHTYLFSAHLTRRCGKISAMTHIQSDLKFKPKESLFF